MIRSAVLLIPLLLPQAPTPQSPGVDPAALARAVQERYDRVRDFSADFTHTYEGGVLKKRVVERGTVQVKKPGRMRWRYTSPEEKLFVSDGRQNLFVCPGESPGHRQPDAAGGPGDDGSAVSGRKG